MPEYLSPGVYIEEIPSSLRAIEGVSTSTAAFVGRARRGPVPGYVWPSSGTPNLPFTPAGGFVLNPDPSPVLVTSFPEFQRTFGTPLPIPLAGDPTDYGYLGWAVRAFFDNGGKRAYVARIVDGTDKPSTLTVAQGAVYLLSRSAAAGDGTGLKPLQFRSTRGLNAGDVIEFRKLLGGTAALGGPAASAIATGGTGPFALMDGDQLDVITNTPAASLSGNVVAKPARTQTSGAVPFNVPDGATLQVRVGPATGPVQTVIFSAADAITPITAGAATLSQVQAVLQRYVAGVKVSQAGGQVVVETQVIGTAARLEIVAGTAVAPLGLAVGVNLPPAGGTVPDAAHATIADVAGLFASANFAVSADTAGRLRFASTATGSGVTLELNDSLSPNPNVLQRLGFGPVSPSLTVAGAAAVPSNVQVASHDIQSNRVTLSAPLPAALDATAVYGVVTGPVTTVPVAGTGPKFIARSPGSWSADVSVAIFPSDRSPVPVTTGALVGATTLQVQAVSSLYVGASIEVDHNGATRSIHQVTAINAGTRVITIDPGLPTTGVTVPGAWVRALEIDVVVTDHTGSAPTEVYRGMAWNQSGNADLRRHYASSINARSRLVWVQPPVAANEGFDLTRQPTTEDGFAMKPAPADVGTDGLVDAVATWRGVDNGPGMRSGIKSFIDLTEARLIAAPGKTAQDIQLELMNQCELLRYRFAILDGEQDPAGGSITSIMTHRSLYDTSFAAYYQPWVEVTVDGQKRYLPPSGYLAGIYARVDNDRGVWKAPANEMVMNVLGLKTNFTTGEQDLLNPHGVNLIRRFDIGGIRVWGARTLSSNADVKYINVRRTLIFLEASIDRGTQWVVFEPNAPETWVRLTDSVSAFLLTQWRAGALFGRKPEDAFFVRCDESTMTSDDILNGRLICEIGVAIVRPAEFVIFRIEQITKFAGTL